VNKSAIVNHLVDNTIDDYYNVNSWIKGSSWLKYRRFRWRYFDGLINIYGNSVGAIFISPIDD
jgi:hypothetical protein